MNTSGNQPDLLGKAKEIDGRLSARGLMIGGALTVALVIAAIVGALAIFRPGPSTARPAATAAPNILDQRLSSAAVYVATISGPEDYLYAVNARTGKILRRSILDDRELGAILTSSAGVVYIASGDGAVTKLDPTTGRQLWVAPNPHSAATSADHFVTVAGSMIYVNDISAATYALDATTGKLIWLHDSGLNAHLNPVNNNFIEVCGWPPTVAGGLVYQSSGITAGTGRIYALDAATGAVRWQVALGAPAASPPRVSAGTLYVAMTGGSIAAFNATTGVKLWSAHPTTATLNGGLALAGSIVYGMGTDGALYAVNATTGAPVAIAWHAAQGPQFHDINVIGFLPPLSAVDGTLYDGWAGGFLTALNGSDGSLLWQYDDAHGNPDSGPSSPPTVFDGAVFFTDRDGNLTALRASDGKLAWRIAPGGDTPTSPAIAA